MTWAAAVSPFPVPQVDDVVASVDEAVLTPFARGPLHTPTGPQHWMTGAVHDRDGVLVRQSLRSWADDSWAPAAGDPELVVAHEGAPRLDGTWLYVGHWVPHFGHFLTEMLTCLWPDPASLAPRPVGLVGHRSFRGAPPDLGGRHGPRVAELKDWQAELVRLAGYGEPVVQVVRTKEVRVERLHVPARSLLLKAWASPKAVDVWRRVSEAVGERASHERVYLSRTQHHARKRSSPATTGPSARTEPEWDAHLDAAFAAAGFHVVHPELLTIREQIALVRGAGVLAGSSGSGLHLSAFATPGTRVLEVGDTLSTGPMRTQQLIDAACGNLTDYVDYRDAEGLRKVLATADE